MSEPYCKVCSHSHLAHKFSLTEGFCRVKDCKCGLPVGALKDGPNVADGKKNLEQTNHD